MTHALSALTFALLAALPVRAEGTDFAPIREARAFVAMVEGRTLRIPLYGLTLVVAPDGSISGKAMGRAVTGRWRWDGGYFCREMDWSGTNVPFNCQLVEAHGDRMRFTVDRGKGESAVFRLR